MKTRNSGRGIGARFVSFIVRRPVVSLFIGLMLIGAAAPGLRYLKQNFTYRTWFTEDDPLIKRFDKFERRFENDDTITVAIHSPSGIFDRDSAKLLLSFTAQLWKMPDVIRVNSLSNFKWVRAKGDDVVVDDLIPDNAKLTPALLAQRRKVALEHKLLPGYLVSPDGRTTMLYARLKPAFDGPRPEKPVVDAVRALIQRHAGSGDHQFHIYGAPVLRNTFRESAFSDVRRLVPVMIGVTIFFLLMAFRRLSGVLLPLGVVALSVVGALGIAGFSDVEINNMTSILPQILIAIGVAGAVHVLVSYFQARRAGADRRSAAQKSLAENLQATLLTNFTTAIGFVSFATAEVAPLAQLGVMAAIGSMVAWLTTYLVVGPLLVLLPLRVKPEAPGAHRDQSKDASPRGRRISDALYRWRKALVAGGVALGLVAAGIAATSKVSSDPYLYFAEDMPLVKATHFIEKQVGGSVGFDVVVDSGKKEGVKDPVFLRKVEALQHWIQRRPETVRTFSIVDTLKEVNRALSGGDPRAYRLADRKAALAQHLLLYTMSLPQGTDINDQLTVKNDALRMKVLWKERESTAALDGIADIEAHAKKLGLNAYVTGKFHLFSALQPHIANAFLRSLALALLLVSLVLVVALRSIRMGLLAMVPNAIPLVVGAALLKLMGKSIDVGTAIMASVTLGIAVDDTIHFLSKYLRLRKEGTSPRDAVAILFTHLAPALIITTVVLVATFGTLSFASFLPNRDFGVMVAVMLSVALVVDLIVLPALLMLWDRRGEAAPATEAERRLLEATASNTQPLRDEPREAA